MRILHRHTDGGSLRLAAACSGDLSSRPVVLVHGMASDHTTWAPLHRELRTVGRSVVSVDLRGHGRSGRATRYRLNDFRDDLAFVADELGLDEFDLVGHSLGAHTALRLAMELPGRVRRLVLEECPPMPRDQADVDEKIVPTATLGEKIRGVSALVANPLPLLRFDRSLPNMVGREFEVAAPRWWADLAESPASTLVISGGDRSFLPPRHLRSLANALPEASFRTIEAGHSVHRDRSREFTRAVLDFLAE
ncbi:alpha/beta fold hydrolase [Gordonia sp. CPCC 205333]|uniref:alpha/beta fold hydrolase n=1 Tax=Gordonia sp. CPCC 205333 TaxID=3140790 RepID=UPI003AF3C5F0